MSRMVAHAEPTPDDLGDALQRPELRFEAEAPRALQEQPGKLAALARREPRRGPRIGLRPDAVLAPAAVGAPPLRDGPGGDVDDPRHFANAVAFVQQGDGAESPCLPFLLGPSLLHAADIGIQPRFTLDLQCKRQ